MSPRVTVLPAMAACLAGLTGLAIHVGLRTAEAYSAPTQTAEIAADAPSHPTDPIIPLRPPAAAAGVSEDLGAAMMPASPDAEAVAVPDPADPSEVAGVELAALPPDAGTEASASGEAEPRRHVVEVGLGDTLLGLLVDSAVPREEAVQVIEALRSVFNPRSLQIGQQVALLFDGEDGSEQFIGLELEPNVERAVTVSRTEDASYEAVAIEKPLELQSVAAEATIRSSLFEAGTEAGVPLSVLSHLIKVFSYDVDFQRDVHPGDGFRVLFERYVTDTGQPARDGDVLYAALVLSGKETEVFRYATPDGTVDYFNRKGESIRRALLRTPVDGARVTSNFGMRRHPILGYSKMHKGIDFGAPTGTPVYAAGSGVIEEIGPKGAYGNYVRIRHNRGISTAYAHLSRFGKSLKRGSKVQQGQVIAYVGSTGRSTGPHLHYEILKDNRQINPLSVDLPTGIQLEGKELAAFKKSVEQIERDYARLGGYSQIAQTVNQKVPAGTPLPPVKPACSAEPGC